ncbi:monocarboxylate transporter 5 isoform X2 [Patella vulgata]|nr:monocarboxylate transporter 5 isoform X2 [Patella vulgata]
MAKKKDIDQGWAWVVLFAAFTSLGIYTMITLSTGIFQVEFLKEFEGTRSKISLIGSTHIGLNLFLGILASVICNIFSIRFSSMLGAAIYTFGLMLSSFSTTFEELLLFYGILTGIGSGIFYTSANVITSHYFHKKRLFACGITFSSPGIGYMFGPTLIRYLIELYGWRSAMAIMSCIMAHTLILTALFFPMHEGNKSNYCPSKCIKRDTKSNKSLKVSMQDPLNSHPLLQNSNQNSNTHPKIEDHDSLLTGPPMVQICHRTSENDRTYERNTCRNATEDRSPEMLKSQQGSKSLPFRNEFNNSDSSINSSNIRENIKDSVLMPLPKTENILLNSTRSLSSVSRRHLHTSDNLMWASHSSIQYLGNQLADEENIPTTNKSSCKPNLSVLKNKALWCLSLSQFFIMCGYCVNFIHYPSMILSKGIDISVVPQLYITRGISLIVARILGGLFCGSSNINILVISFGCQMLLGVVVFCLPFLGDTIWAYHLCQFLFAFYYGGTYVVLSQILVLILGLNNLATGFGIQMMMAGIAYFITPSLAGWLYDITDSYDLAYFFSGSIIFAGAFFVPMIQIFEQNSFTNDINQDIEIEEE